MILPAAYVVVMGLAGILISERAASRFGEGSTFSLQLPAAEALPA